MVRIIIIIFIVFTKVIINVAKKIHDVNYIDTFTILTYVHVDVNVYNVYLKLKRSRLIRKKKII